MSISIRTSVPLFALSLAVIGATIGLALVAGNDRAVADGASIEILQPADGAIVRGNQFQLVATASGFPNAEINDFGNPILKSADVSMELRVGGSFKVVGPITVNLDSTGGGGGAAPELPVKGPGINGVFVRPTDGATVNGDRFQIVAQPGSVGAGRTIEITLVITVDGIETRSEVTTVVARRVGP